MLLRQLASMGVEPAPGMPIDEAHAMMAVHVLSQMLAAHRRGLHTAYCSCSLGDAP